MHSSVAKKREFLPAFNASCSPTPQYLIAGAPSLPEKNDNQIIAIATKIDIDAIYAEVQANIVMTKHRLARRAKLAQFNAAPAATPHRIH